MSGWTESAIAIALHGRFYLMDGTCRYEKREQEDRQKREAAEAAEAIKAFRRQEAARLIAKKGPLTAASIIAAVAHAHGLGVGDVTGRSRARHIIHARQHACALMRELTGLPLQSIANAVNLTDHSTAHHAIKTWADRGKTYAAADRTARSLLGLEEAA